MDRVKRIWYLSPMRAAKVQASLRIRAVSPEPPLLAHTSSESTFRQKARSLAPLNGWACAVKICNDGMLEDTNSLDAALMINKKSACTEIYFHRNFILLQRFFYSQHLFSDFIADLVFCLVAIIAYNVYRILLLLQLSSEDIIRLCFVTPCCFTRSLNLFN